MTLRYLFAQYHKQIMQILIVFVGSGDTAIPLGSPKLSVHLSPLCAVLQEAKLCGLHLLWSLGNSGKRSEGRRQEGQAKTLGPQVCLVALSLFESSSEDHSSAGWPSTQRPYSITPRSSSVAQVPRAGLSCSSSGLKMVMVSSFLL